MHKPKEGFYVMGRVKDLKSVMRTSRVLLAPLQFGAGIKGKLIDAMKNGIPNITTEIGAEGMHKGMPWNVAITNDCDAVAQAAITLYYNTDEWHEAQQNGVSIINQLYDKDVWEEKLMAHFEVLQNRLDAHRDSNFIGGLIQHQTLASTKYMGKWIEAKNNK